MSREQHIREAILRLNKALDLERRREAFKPKERLEADRQIKEAIVHLNKALEYP